MPTTPSGRSSAPDRQRDDDRTCRALDVAIQGFEEAIAVLGRDQRVEEDDGVGRLEVDRPDLLLPALRPAFVRRPVRVEARPAPQPGGDLVDAHG
jgi:hypothetical protein